MARLAAAEATFARGINLNGPAVTIYGRAWEANATAARFRASGKAFANQKVALRPPADTPRVPVTGWPRQSPP